MRGACFQQITEENPAPWALYPHPTQYALSRRFYGAVGVAFPLSDGKEIQPQGNSNKLPEDFKSCLRSTILYLNAYCDVIQLATVLAPTAVSLEFKIPVSLIPRPVMGQASSRSPTFQVRAGPTFRTTQLEQLLHLEFEIYFFSFYSPN